MFLADLAMLCKFQLHRCKFAIYTGGKDTLVEDDTFLILLAEVLDDLEDLEELVMCFMMGYL